MTAITLSGAPDRPGSEVGADIVGIEGGPDDRPDSVDWLAGLVNVVDSHRGIVKVGTEHCLGGGQ